MKYLAVDPLASKIAICWGGIATHVQPEWKLNINFCDLASGNAVPFQALPTRSPGPTGTQLAAFSPSGRILAASPLGAEVVHLIDAEQPRVLFTLESRKLITCLGIAWSPDGKLLARLVTTGGSPMLHLWRLPNGDDPDHIQAESAGLVSLKGKKSAFQFGGRGVAFSPNSDLVAVGGLKKPNVFRLYSVARSEFVAESAPLAGQVTGLAFSPDGTHVFCGDDKGTVQAWRLEGADRSSLVKVDSAELRQSIVGLEVDRDAKTLCVASASKKSVDLFTATLPG